MPFMVEKLVHRMCEKTDWSLSQLSIQKGLYISHMVHLGQNSGSPLVSEQFEAWDYGPVLPSVYQMLKMFGRKPVKNIFLEANGLDGTSAADVIDVIAAQIKEMRPASLVHYTHDPKGAWAKHYCPGARGVTIPNEDILSEYDWRSKEAA